MDSDFERSVFEQYCTPFIIQTTFNHLKTDMSGFLTPTVFTFVKRVWTIGHSIADPTLRNAGIFVIPASEFMTGLSVKVFRIAVLFVAVVKTVGMTVAVPDLRDTKSCK